MHGRSDGAGELALIHEPVQQAGGDSQSHSGEVGPAGVLRVCGICMAVSVSPACRVLPLLSSVREQCSPSGGSACAAWKYKHGNLPAGIQESSVGVHPTYTFIF